MNEEIKNPCPTCLGKKYIEGVCETSSEWQGPDSEDGMICTPDALCPTCGGSGVKIDQEQE